MISEILEFKEAKCERNNERCACEFLSQYIKIQDLSPHPARDEDGNKNVPPQLITSTDHDLGGFSIIASKLSSRFNGACSPKNDASASVQLRGMAETRAGECRSFERTIFDELCGSYCKP